jgi:hypothetical protein
MRSLLTLATEVDRLYELRTQRLQLEKEVELCKAEETKIKDLLIANISKSDSTGISGLVARATVKVNRVASVNDWPKFYAYILKNKAFELLQKRVTNSAVLERVEAGEKVAGVELMDVPMVSITKLGGV